METYVLMIFAYTTHFSQPNGPPVFHSVYGFPSTAACERAYNALSPSSGSMSVNHTCELVTLTDKSPDPLFIPFTPPPRNDKKTHR